MIIKVLLVEQDPRVGTLVKTSLEKESFEVEWMSEGNSALDRIEGREYQPDLCILDTDIAGLDSYNLAREIRRTKPNLAIMFISSQTEVNEIEKVFSCGADDYIRKPFHFEELKYKIKMLMRRIDYISTVPRSDQIMYSLGLYEFYPEKQLLCFKGKKIPLSYKESNLLREFVERKDQLVERKAVLKKLWGDDNFFNARNMDVYIVKLRKYLSQDPDICITNLRGIGYKLIY